MNRPIAVTQPPIATVNPTHATAAQEKKPRRVTPSSAPVLAAAGLAAGVAGAGFAAGGGAGAVPLAATVPVAAAALATAAGAGFGAGGLPAAAGGAVAACGWETWGALVPPAMAGASATGVAEEGVLKVSAVAAGVSGPDGMAVLGAAVSALAPSVALTGGTGEAAGGAPDSPPALADTAWESAGPEGSGAGLPLGSSAIWPLSENTCVRPTSFYGS
jgi:hypothetical protein